MLVRSTLTIILSVLLLGLGAGLPAGAEQPGPVVPTATARLDGLPPPAEQPGIDGQPSPPGQAGGSGRADTAGEARGPGQAGGAGEAGPVRLSAPVRTPIPFSLLGVRVPVGAAVDLRTSVDGREWSAWHEADADPEEGPDGDPPGDGGGVWSQPLWVGEAAWVQVRVSGGAPEDVAVHLVDSAGVSRSWAQRVVDVVRGAWDGPPAAHATVPAPPVVSRAQWGADESLRRDEPSYARRNRFGVLHHTAGTNDYTRAQGPAIVRGIYTYHVQANGWNDIGYNLLVDRFGTIYEGRYGGLEQAVIGAHAGGFNAGSFGVAVLGTFTGTRPPAEAMDALARVFAWKFDVHHLDVAGAATVTSGGSSRYPAGQRVRVATLSAHRDLSSTACPGDALYGLLPALRQRVLELGGAMLLDHDAQPGVVTVAAGTSLDGPITFSIRLRPPGEWQLVVRDEAGTVVHRDAGEGEQVTSTWAPQGAAPGRYTYTFASPGRRSASDWVDLLPPTITGADARPDVVRLRDGALAEPVSITATAYRGAAWEVIVSDPDGTLVHQTTGRGEEVTTRWGGPTTGPGTYSWRISAPGAEPATGSIDVFADVLRRVGATPDAPAVAVALSREAFPAALSARHAVLARDDLFPDALAGGPLAGRDGPVLLTGRDRLDPRVREELERVLPAGARVYVLGGEQALSSGVAADLAQRWRVERLAGQERTETAAAVAAAVLANSPGDTALVARAWPDTAMPWADALAGGAFGAAAGQPVLLTDPGRLSPATAGALEELAVRRTVVLGGPAAVSDAVVRDLPEPRRVAGAERAETAAEVAARLWGRTTGASGDRFVFTAGTRPEAWVHALAAAPLAARRSAPLLLVHPDRVPPATVSYLEGLGYARDRVGGGWVVGPQAAVAPSVADAAARLLQ